MTKLDAVNKILREAGGHPIFALDTDGASPKGVQVKNTSTNSLGFDNSEHNGITAGEVSSVTASASPLGAAWSGRTV